MNQNPLVLWLLCAPPVRPQLRIAHSVVDAGYREENHISALVDMNNKVLHSVASGDQQGGSHDQRVEIEMAFVALLVRHNDRDLGQQDRGRGLVASPLRQRDRACSG